MMGRGLFLPLRTAVAAWAGGVATSAGGVSGGLFRRWRGSRTGLGSGCRFGLRSRDRGLRRGGFGLTGFPFIAMGRGRTERFRRAHRALRAYLARRSAAPHAATPPRRGRHRDRRGPSADSDDCPQPAGESARPKRFSLPHRTRGFAGQRRRRQQRPARLGEDRHQRQSRRRGQAEKSEAGAAHPLRQARAGQTGKPHGIEELAVETGAHHYPIGFRRAAQSDCARFLNFQFDHPSTRIEPLFTSITTSPSSSVRKTGIWCRARTASVPGVGCPYGLSAPTEITASFG